MPLSLSRSRFQISETLEVGNAVRPRPVVRSSPYQVAQVVVAAPRTLGSATLPYASL